MKIFQFELKICTRKVTMIGQEFEHYGILLFGWYLKHGPSVLAWREVRGKEIVGDGNDGP